MDIQAISLEIVKIRGRLREIESERQGVAEGDLATKTDLHDEEIELKRRVAELQDLSVGAPAQDRKPNGKAKPEEYSSSM